MIRQRVDDDFIGLGQITTVFVLTPANVCQGSAVRAAAGAVNGAKCPLAETAGAQTKELIAMHGADTLGEFGNAGGSQWLVARTPNDALPTRESVEGSLCKVGIHGKRQNHVDHLGITVEDGEKILAKADFLGNLLEQPYVPVESIALTLLGLSSGPAQPSHGLNGGSIPIRWKDELCALLRIKEQERHVGSENLLLRVKPPPMDTAMNALTGELVNMRRLCAGINISTKLVSGHPIRCQWINLTWHDLAPL